MCKRFYNIYNDYPNRIFQSINLVSNVQLNDWTRSKVFRHELFQQKQVKASEEFWIFCASVSLQNTELRFIRSQIHPNDDTAFCRQASKNIAYEQRWRAEPPFVEGHDIARTTQSQML